MVTVVRAIEALPVVTVLSPLAVSSKNKPWFRVGLRCFSCQENASCGQQQAGPVRITNTRTTLLACLQELHKQMVDGHGACCVDAARAADRSATSSSSTADACLSGAASNVMDLMMQLSNVKARAMVANKVALEAKQAKDALETEVQAWERAMKRPRTEASSTQNTEGMKVDEDMWDLGHHRREATRLQNLRNIGIGSVEEAPAPRTGKVGYLNHPRLGLIGSVAYWARGGMAHAVTMIVALTVKLGITERVRNALPETQTTCDTWTTAKIVDLLEAGLAETKQCKNEQQLQACKWEDYKGTRFYDGERALVIKRWLNRVDEDALGFTFEEWDPTENVDSSQMPEAMIIISSELSLRAAGFMLREVFPPELEAPARRRSTRGAGIRQYVSMGPKHFILSVDDDTEFRSRCELICICVLWFSFFTKKV